MVKVSALRGPFLQRYRVDMTHIVIHNNTVTAVSLNKCYALRVNELVIVELPKQRAFDLLTLVG